MREHNFDGALSHASHRLPNFGHWPGLKVVPRGTISIEGTKFEPYLSMAWCEILPPFSLRDMSTMQEI